MVAIIVPKREAVLMCSKQHIKCGYFLLLVKLIECRQVSIFTGLLYLKINACTLNEQICYDLLKENFQVGKKILLVV